MAKTNKDKQWYAKRVLYNIVCPCWFWPWYFLTFFDVFCIPLFVLVRFGHGIVWRSSMCFVLHCLSLLVLSITHRRTSDTTMANTNKDKQCYTKHIEERQTIPWPKPTRTNNVIQNTSKNVRHGFGHGIVWRSSMCFVLHCLSLLVLAMVVSDVLRCVSNNIVCPCWFWPW
jgi:hypothetical protein